MSHRNWSQSRLMRTGSSAGLHLQKELDGQGVYTVQFNVSGPPAASDGVNTVRRRIFARVTWSVGGNTVDRLMSVLDGCSISGTAENVDVRVFDASVALAGAIAPVEYDYVVSAQISVGARPNIQQPVILDLFTTPVDVAPGLVGNFLIDAALTALGVDGTGGIVSLCTYCGVLDPGLIDPAVAAAAVPSGIVSAAQVVAGLVDLEMHDPREIAGWTPIIPGATRMRYDVSANSPVGFRFYTLFGVDG